MSNTYALTTTAGKEFVVEQDLKLMGLSPWVPCRIIAKSIKQKKQSVLYDLPYIPKLIFASFPATYYRKVCNLKHVTGKPIALSERDEAGTPAYKIHGTGSMAPARPGLVDFRRIVEKQAYENLKRAQDNDWGCRYEPGDALKILEGVFSEEAAEFKKVVIDAATGKPAIEVEITMFGRPTRTRIQPHMVAVA